MNKNANNIIMDNSGTNPGTDYRNNSGTNAVNNSENNSGNGAKAEQADFRCSISAGTSEAIDAICKLLPADRALRDEPMREHTSFRIGGPAALLATVNNEAELAAVLKICSGAEKGSADAGPACDSDADPASSVDADSACDSDASPVCSVAAKPGCGAAAGVEGGAMHMLIGNGSNLLVSDAGYPGIVIKLGGDFEAIEILQDDSCITEASLQDACRDGGIAQKNHEGSPGRGVAVRVGAARLLSGVSRFLTEHGLAGFEFASGIPGSVGGAVYMNAGAYGGEIKDVVTAVRLMSPDGGDIREVSAGEMDFGYRHSAIEDNGMIVLSAVMRLTPGDPVEIAAIAAELQAKRNAKQPVNFPSAGSTFKRPASGFAAALIDASGLKGYRVGGAMVSEKHAGFVINTGGATAEDVLAVMRHVRSTVFADSGITLEPEIRMVNCTLSG